MTQERLLEHLPEFEGEVVCVDRDRESLDHEPTTPPDVAVSQDNQATRLNVVSHGLCLHCPHKDTITQFAASLYQHPTFEHMQQIFAV